MAKPTTRSKPSLRRSTRTNGLTVLELLVAAAISLLVMGAAFAVTMSSRRLMQADQTRTGANQNLRAALDIIGNDVRLAGERLSGQGAPDIPEVEVIGGTELVLRRNVLENVLPVCTLSSGAPASGRVLVSLLGSDKNTSYPQCNGDGPRDADRNGTPDDLAAWGAYRTKQRGGKARAYIHSNARGGEYFTYTGEDKQGNQGHYIARSGGGFANPYTMQENANLYLLDERRYRVAGGVLELILNDDQADPLKVVNDVQNFQVRAKMKDGTKLANFVSSASTWKNVASIEVSFQVEGRTLTSEYFPRNVLSY